MGTVDKRSKRMRTSRDVIDRFFHDATFDTEQVSVGYLDRCAGGLVERPLSAFFHGDICTVGPDVLRDVLQFMAADNEELLPIQPTSVLGGYTLPMGFTLEGVRSVYNYLE